MLRITRNILSLGFSLLFAALSQQDTPACDINNRVASCPTGYCCVRDDFLPELIYCKRIGGLKHSCNTKPTLSDCPCADGLVCKPNVQAATYTSLYGRCENASVPTTVMPGLTG